MRIPSPAFHRCPQFQMSQTFDDIKAEQSVVSASDLVQIREKHGLNPNKPVITRGLKPGLITRIRK